MECSVKGCQASGRHACGKCQAKLCGQAYCSMFHSGICGRISSSPSSSSVKSVAPVKAQLQPVPAQVHSAVDAFILRKQDKQLLKVASLAREQGDGSLATMCINKHLALNATIGAAMSTGYQESAAVPASEVWSDILERLAFQSENKAVTSALTKIKYAIGQDVALQPENRVAAMELASDMALMAMEGHDAEIEAFADEFPVGAEMIGGYFSRREQKRYAKQIENTQTTALITQANGYAAKLNPSTAKGISGAAKAFLAKIKGSRGKNKARLRAIESELNRRLIITTDLTTQDAIRESLGRISAALTDQQ